MLNLTVIALPRVLVLKTQPNFCDMALTLIVDDRKIEEPDNAAIAREFESIDKKTGFRSRGLSLVILQRGEDDSLTVGGHPVEGWGGLIHEHKGVDYSAKLSGSLAQEKIIQIFRSYARGDDLWEKEFEWQDISAKTNWHWILIGTAILVVLLFFARRFLK